MLHLCILTLLPTFCWQVYGGLSRRQAMSVHTFNMVLYAALIPVGGMLCDRIGRLPLLVGPALLVALLAWPLWALLSTTGSVMAALEGQVRTNRRKGCRGH